jgi:hypothetical protein
MAKDLWDLTDEELEAQLEEARAEVDSPETEIEEEEAYEDTEEEEIEVEDMEQPEDQDSDDDTSSDDEEEDDSEEETEETDEDDADGQSEEDEAETTDEEEETEEDEQPVETDEKLTFKANGQEYEFTTGEMKEQFGKVFGQAMDYTKKMQQIKPWRKTIDAIETANLSHDDVNFAIDLLKGDKDAIAELVKRTGVDALDLDTEGDSSYVARDYGRNDTELAIKDIVDDISGDKEYAITHSILEKQWDDTSRDEFIKNPRLIKELHTDVKSGLFDKISPIMQKIKVYDGGDKSDLDYYSMAASKYFKELEDAKAAEAEKVQARDRKVEQEAEKVKAVKEQQVKRVETKQASKKRKAAAPTNKVAGTKKVIDYLDDSDEAFEEWYRDKIENH